MRHTTDPFTILMADDDTDDCLLVRDAFMENPVNPVGNRLRFVHDGEELLDYLHRRGKYAGSDLAPRPVLILLDLNMPKKDGREALKEIKSDPDIRGIPIVVLTTSKEETDIVRSYELGASSFIIKPVTFNGLVETIKSFGKYWFEIVELPGIG